MRDYFERFTMILMVMAAVAVVFSAIGYVISLVFDRFGMLGGLVALLVLSCALAATMPDGGHPPR